ncbi:hypothetical protein EDD21DRAFT_188217 [Dissophora ornata]|nr:hypothetical protein EDD21DRAFT_188217 [Dissophora ornata]
MAAEDVVVVKRGSGLTRHGPSLLRRSARTKIRRNSTTSSEARNDTSRLRSAPIENDEYPAVTLVDPGPMPLPFSPLSLSMVSESTPASFDASENDSAAQKEVDHKPLKRFVSTLRDSSKPTITTYVEPQLLEQRRKELEGTSRLSESIPTSYITSTTTVTTATNLDTPSHPVNGGPASTEPSTQLTLESAVISKVTYPIPPPVKLSQNLLQQPKLPDPRSQVPPKHPSLSIQSAPPQKQMIVMQNQSSPANIPRPQPQSKKSSSWSWLWGKEKGGDKAMDMAQREPQKPFSALSSQPHLSNTPNEVVGKKQSTLSLLFSRNGKSSKAQSTSAESGAPSSFPGQMPIQGDRLNDPSRMPINIERAVYRLSHVKLANPRRPLHEQVLISNMMFWYLGVIQQQQQLLLQQQQQADLQQQQGQQQQQQQLQDQNQQQLPAEQSAEYVNPGTGEPAHLSPTSNDDETLEKKKSHQDGLSAVVETKVEGSEFVVPQQDSNSRARSPVEEVVLVQEIVYTQTLLHTHNHAIPSAPHEEEYDEESMIGGHFGGNSTWYDEEDYENYEDDMDAMTGGYKRSGAGSLYLQSGNQVSDSYKIHAMQTSGAC